MPSIAELSRGAALRPGRLRTLPGNVLSTQGGATNTMTNILPHSGLAAPLVAGALGKATAQQQQAGGRQSQIQEFLLLFSKMARTNKGVAVKFWNANSKDIFGDDYPIDSVKTDKDGAVVHMAESGDFVRMSPDGISIWATDETGEQAWRPATEQDIQRIGAAKKTLKSIGRGRRGRAGDSVEASIQKLDAEIGKLDRQLSGLDPAAKRMNKRDIDNARKRRDALMIEREELRKQSRFRKDVNLPGSDASLGGRFAPRPQGQPQRPQQPQRGGLPPLLPGRY